MLPGASDKPSGLVVDFLGIADQLKKALAAYTERDQEQTGISQEEALSVLQEKYEVVTAMFHGFEKSGGFSPPSGDVPGLLELLTYPIYPKQGE